jgi:hypothetical protein
VAESWNSMLETRGESQKIASRWRNRVSRKKPAEINHVQTVIEVLSVGLKAHGEPVALVHICANGRIDGKRGLHTTAVKIDAIHDGLAVLRQRFGGTVRDSRLWALCCPCFSVTS